MIGNHAQGNIGFRILPIFHTRNAHDMPHNALHRINFKNIIHILHHAGEALNAHAGINIGVLQPRIIAVAVVFKLREYQVPDFYKAIAFAPYAAIRRSAAVALPSVKVQLRAGAAGAGAVLPEVIRLAHALYVRRVKADLLRPDLIGLRILLINRHINPIGGHADHLRKEFPRPGDGLALKIIAKGEIAQHLKKGAMAGGLAHIFNIRRAHALLAGRHAFARRRYLTGKKLFHRRHAGVDEQQALIPLRDERKARHAQVALALKKTQVFFTKVV